MTEYFIFFMLFVLINLIILGLNLKLYTEILKDKKQDSRHD
jgi:hypothetical protein